MTFAHESPIVHVMKSAVLAAIGALAAATPFHAVAQLSSESIVGTEKYCNYEATPVGGSTRSIKIGIGERCPAHFPTVSKNLPPPPTARLEASSVKEGQRVCIYGQRNRTWSFTITLAERCAPTAGMFSEQEIAPLAG